MKRTVLNMLQEAVDKYGNRPYTYDKGDKRYVARTFREVQEEARYFATSLVERGFNKNDKIAIIAEGRSQWIISEYGILMAACVAVPLSIKLLPEEILFRLNHSEAKAIVLSRNTFEKVAPIWRKINKDHCLMIYLDDETDDIEQIASEYDIDLQHDMVLLSRLIGEGRKHHVQNSQKLKEIEDNIEENDLVTICYTSGTTGNPKGIMLTHLNYYANSRDAMFYFNVHEYHRLYIILPLDHSFAHTICIYAALLRALSIYFVDARGGSKATLRNIPINLKEANPHFMLTVPALSGNFMNKIIDGIHAKGGMAEKLFNMGMQSGMAMFGDGYESEAKGLRRTILRMKYNLANKIVFKKVRTVFGTSLKYSVGGGALLDIRQQRFFYSLGIPVYQGYGLTEATPIISANTPAVHKLGTSGKVLPTITCKIMKNNGQEAKSGEKGEIVIKGNNVMAGYYKNPEATSQVLRDGWLWTGDLGYYDQDGFLVVVGREKALLISQDGEKYSPEGIEEAIVNTAGLIDQVMLYNDHKKFTSALITLNTGRIESLIEQEKITSTDELLSRITESLNRYKAIEDYAGQFPEIWQPSQFRILHEPFTEQNHMINSTMKMVRYKILEAYQSQIDELYECNTAQIQEKNKQVLAGLFSLD